jgi:hypothetical protein
VARRSADQLATASQALSMRLLQATTDTSNLSGALAVFDAQAGQQRAEEIKAGGELLAQLDQTLAAERLQIQQNFARQALQQQQQAQEAALRAQQQAAEEQQRILEEAQNFLEGSLRRISDWITHFQSSAASNLSPSQQLATAQQAFATQLAAAQGGSRDALSNITGNAQDVVDAVRRYYGSGAAGQTIVDQLIGQLQALPTQVSAEQFIVNGLVTQTESLTETFNGLSEAVALALAGQPAALGAILADEFQSIDTNLDGLLDFNELQQALGATYATGTLKAIDANSDDMVSRAEVINASLGGTPTVAGVLMGNVSASLLPGGVVATATGTTATNAGTTATNTGDVSADTDTLVTNISLARMKGIHENLQEQNLNWGDFASVGGTATNITTTWNPDGQSIPQHELGGLLAGDRHSQGGMMINAEGGEYIFSRNAVNRFGVGTLDAMNFGGIAANDNAVVMAIQAQTVVLMRGIAALIQAELEAAGIISRPIEDANKLQRARRGEKKAA